MDNADYLPQKMNWQQAICPICSKEYLYVKGHIKPRTCGSFDCLFAFAMKILDKRGKG